MKDAVHVAHTVVRCCRLRYAEWQARMQPLESRLKEYRNQHLTCTNGDAMPGPYLVVHIEDKAAGIGNELPGVITGTVVSLHASLGCCCCQSLM